MVLDDELNSEAHEAVVEIFGDAVAQACWVDPTLTRLGRALDQTDEPTEQLQHLHATLDPARVMWLARRARNPATWIANNL